MTPIKLLLALPLLALLLFVITRLHNQTFYRLLLIAVTLCGIGLVMYPDISARIAAYLGVGRGVDLVIYVGGVVVFIVLVALYAKLRRIQQVQTEIIRQLTLAQASRPEEGH